VTQNGTSTPRWQLIEADCIEAMRDMDEASVDAIVTDPPYGLEFMGKEWDRLGDVGKASHQGFTDGSGFKGFRLASLNASANVKCQNCGKWKWDHEGRKCECAEPRFADVRADQSRRMQTWHHAWAVEALRVLKPGGHLLAFGGTRTFHRLTCALEDAGFEIRDCLSWLYGSGFPKSLDVSKAIDKAAGAEREVVGAKVYPDGTQAHNGPNHHEGYQRPFMADPEWQGTKVTAPATEEAQRWQGWGTALKPAWEPIILARKPLSERNVAANVQRWGTGALNIDGCRIEFSGEDDEAESKGKNRHADFGSGPRENHVYGADERARGEHGNYDAPGRWPPNVALDPEAARLLDEQTGELKSPATYQRNVTGFVQAVEYRQLTHGGVDDRQTQFGYGDTGGASRFLYVAKADREERDRGLGHRPLTTYATHGAQGQGPLPQQTPRERDLAARNSHPTVKPVELMRWLCRMVTPPGGVVLDPFTGSGSTGIAALREGFSFIGIEREAEYVEIARDRIIGDSPMFNVPAEVRA
jgi:DNA modification methylase